VAASSPVVGAGQGRGGRDTTEGGGGLGHLESRALQWLVVVGGRAPFLLPSLVHALGAGFGLLLLLLLVVVVLLLLLVVVVVVVVLLLLLLLLLLQLLGFLAK
jgi:hypothetical protein